MKLAALTVIAVVVLLANTAAAQEGADVAQPPPAYIDARPPLAVAAPAPPPQEAPPTSSYGAPVDREDAPETMRLARVGASVLASSTVMVVSSFVGGIYAFGCAFGSGGDDSCFLPLLLIPIAQPIVSWATANALDGDGSIFATILFSAAGWAGFAALAIEADLDDYGSVMAATLIPSVLSAIGYEVTSSTSAQEARAREREHASVQAAIAATANGASLVAYGTF